MQRVSRLRRTDDFNARAVAMAEVIGPGGAAQHLDMPIKTLRSGCRASGGGPVSGFHAWLPLQGRPEALVFGGIAVQKDETDSPVRNNRIARGVHHEQLSHQGLEL